MLTLAELLLALITDQPISAEEKREIALHVLRLTRRVREAQELPGMSRRQCRDK